MADCPACGKAMKEVFISGVEIDFCRDGCKGLWFDNFELVKLDEVHEGKGEVLEEILAAKGECPNRPEKLRCPRCNLPMKRRQFRYGSDVEIDNCYGCNGIFLDSGELAQIRKNYTHIQQKSDQFIEDFDSKLSSQATPRPQNSGIDSGERGVGILSKLFGRF
jgi:hypothetical protein